MTHYEDPWYDDVGAVILFNRVMYLELIGAHDPLQDAVLVRELAVYVVFSEDKMMGATLPSRTAWSADDFSRYTNDDIDHVYFPTRDIGPSADTGGARVEELDEIRSRPYWLSMSLVDTAMPLPDFREALTATRGRYPRYFHPETGKEIEGPGKGIV